MTSRSPDGPNPTPPFWPTGRATSTERRLAAASRLGTVSADAANNYAPSTLHDFGGPDGASPQASLIADVSGNLYGTTSRGGLYDSGTVFKLDAANAYARTTLHDFDGSDGSRPVAELIADASGNLYGTNSEGGPSNRGVVFKLEAANGYALTTLHDCRPDGQSICGSSRRCLQQPCRNDPEGRHPGSFRHGLQARGRQGLRADDSLRLCGHRRKPVAAVIADASGNLMERLPRAALTTSAPFSGSTPRTPTPDDPPQLRRPDGAHPVAAVIADASGNLYGTTSDGGGSGLGVVFELDAANAYALTTLHSFDGSDGMHPHAPLTPTPLAASTERPTANTRRLRHRLQLDAANDWALTTLTPSTAPKEPILKPPSSPTTRATSMERPAAAPIRRRHGLQARRRERLPADDPPQLRRLGGGQPSALIADASGNLTERVPAATPTAASSGLDAASNYALATLTRSPASPTEHTHMPR
jgi:uncharacterized repeat protein (TIGR03803 family)